MITAVTLQLLCLCAISGSGYKFPFQNPTLAWDKRVDDLVSRLTLNEVVQQTTANYKPSGTPEISRLGVKPYQWIAECLRGYAYKNATAFPQAIGLGASFRYVSGAPMRPTYYNISFPLLTFYTVHYSYTFFLYQVVMCV